MMTKNFSFDFGLSNHEVEHHYLISREYPGRALHTQHPIEQYPEPQRAQLISGEIVWEYWTPYSGAVRLPDGSTPQPVGENIYATFRATFVPPDHPALMNRNLVPLYPQPSLEE